MVTCMDVHVTFAVPRRHAFPTADGSGNVAAVLVIRFTTGVIGRHDDGYGLVTARKPHILGREKSVVGGDQHGRERDPAQSWLPLNFDRRRTARLRKACGGCRIVDPRVSRQGCLERLRVPSFGKHRQFGACCFSRHEQQVRSVAMAFQVRPARPPFR